MQYYLVFDIGGTHVKYGVLDREFNYKVKSFFKTNIPTIVDDIIKLSKELLEEYPEIKDIGISSTGVVDSEKKMIINANDDFLKYIGTDFKFVEKRLGLKLILENDANAASYAEVSKEKNRFAMVTFGTGVGGGIVLYNELVHSKNHYDGEFGYMIHNGKLVNDELSFTKFNDKTRKLFGFDTNHQDKYRHMYLSNDKFKNHVESYLKNVATFLFNICAALNLDHIYIGGGINHLNVDAKNYLIQQFNEYIISSIFKTKISYSEHGNSAALIGMTKLILKDELDG